MDIEKTEIISEKFATKQLFVGISLGSAVTAESGIAVIDRNMHLVRIDKAFNLNDIQAYIKALSPAENLILCVDLPKNTNIVTNKWRYEAKNTQALRLRGLDFAKLSWTERFSDRGLELCNSLNSLGADVYRYSCYYTKTALRLNSPYKARSPVACKNLQMSIKSVLKVSGIPTNLIAISGLEAIMGAYTAWKIASSKENIGYKCIGNFRNIPIVSAI